MMTQFLEGTEAPQDSWQHRTDNSQSIWWTGYDTNAVVPRYYLDLRKSYDIRIDNSRDNRPHTFHVHGHPFLVLETSEKPSLTTVMRDVVVVPSLGYAIVRVYSDNPGVWLMRSMNPWLSSAGLELLIVDSSNVITGSTMNSTLPDAYRQPCLITSEQSGRRLDSDNDDGGNLALDENFFDQYGDKHNKRVAGVVTAAENTNNRRLQSAYNLSAHYRGGPGKFFDRSCVVMRRAQHIVMIACARPNFRNMRLPFLLMFPRIALQYCMAR